MVHLNKEDIIRIIKEQNFPHGTYVVFGGGPLAVAGIRKTHDIDLFVSDRLYKELEQKGWEVKNGDGGEVLARGEFEVAKAWIFGTYRPRFNDLLSSADIVKGVPFVNLYEVRKWKQHMNRPKDRHDIELIDNFLAHHG